MKTELVLLLVGCLILAGIFPGCLDESTASALAAEMEEKYDSILTYRATIVYESLGGASREYIKTVKKPDKIREGWISPERRAEDLMIVDGNDIFNYDASNQKAYLTSFSSNYGESQLETPDFLAMLLALIENANVNILHDENISGRVALVLDITPNDANSCCRMKFWLDKETYFILKIEYYGPDNTLRRSETITSFEINLEVDDSEFELPEGTEVVNPYTEAAFRDPETFEELESKVGFSVLVPLYLPEGFSLDLYALSTQRAEFEQFAKILYWPEGYANPSSVTTTTTILIEEEDTDNDSNMWDPSINTTELEKAKIWIGLYEALEDVLEDNFLWSDLNANDPIAVSIGDIQGTYWTSESNDGLSTYLWLSWNYEDYWLLIEAAGETAELDETIDVDEIVLIAESLISYIEVECLPGQAIGDVDGDGEITNDDAQLLGYILADLIDPPSTICCCDVNQDGNLSVADVVLISRIANGSDTSPGYCSVGCIQGQQIGDVNGDGTITEKDTAILEKILAELIDPPTSICCCDVNYDGVISVADVVSIERIIAGEEDSPGYCPECFCGQAIGDVDGNGKITENDATMLRHVLVGSVAPANNTCCCDVNQDGNVSIADVVLIERIVNGSYASPGYCPYECSAQQKIGDVDGDGTITAQDADILDVILIGEMDPPSNLCCCDVNQDGKISVSDVVKIQRIAQGLDLFPGYCAGNSSGMTYTIEPIE